MGNRFSESDRQLLKRVIEKRDPLLVGNVEALDARIVDDRVVEKVLDHLGSELATRGFDEHYEPTRYGRQLEDLINKFIRKYKMKDVN